MRKILLTLMMLLMLAQGAWARAAAYCQHEGTPVAKHFGHHSHAHHGDSTGKHAGTGNALLAADSDCGVCALGLACAVPCAAPAIAALAVPPPLALAGVRTHAPHPEQPERPNWQRLA